MSKPIRQTQGRPEGFEGRRAQGKSRGLGRGFDSLFGNVVEDEFDAIKSDHETIQQVNPNSVDPNPHQPRQDFDQAELIDLAASIKQHGILQPLVATKKANRYELIAGERRLRAAKLINLKTVPIIVRSFDEQQKLELALIENLQRQDLNPIETAAAYRKLIDQFNLNYDQLASRVGRNRTTIINVVRLLNLPLDAKRALASGTISEGHARAILAVSEPKRQKELLKLIIDKGWTVRQAEEYSRSAKEQKPEANKPKTASTQTNPFTEQLGKYLKTEVTIEPRAKGGRLVIRYQSDEELENIQKAILK